MADPSDPEAGKQPQAGPEVVKQPEKPVKEIEKGQIKPEKELPEKLTIKPEKEKESFKAEKPEIKEKHEKEKHEKESKLEAKEKHEKESAKEKVEKIEKPEIEKTLVKPEKELPEKLTIKPELEKQVVEGPKTIEGPGPVETLEGRLAAVEDTVRELQHFIKPTDRPDLSEGALTNEEDVPPKQ